MLFVLQLKNDIGRVRRWCFESKGIKQARRRAAILGRPAERFLGRCRWRLYCQQPDGRLNLVSWRTGSGSLALWSPSLRKEKV